MSERIIDALADLDMSIGRVEKATTAHEQKLLKIKQQDLFGGAAEQNSAANVTRQDVVQKLDGTIAKVEEMLEQA